MSAENCERVGFKFKFLVWKTFDPAWQSVDLWEIMNMHLHNGAVKTEIFSCQYLGLKEKKKKKKAPALARS